MIRGYALDAGVEGVDLLAHAVDLRVEVLLAAVLRAEEAARVLPLPAREERARVVVGHAAGGHRAADGRPAEAAPRLDLATLSEAQAALEGLGALHFFLHLWMYRSVRFVRQIYSRQQGRVRASLF